MLNIHPIIQASATLLSLYVLYLGLMRFRFLHLKHKTAFNWQRHVRLGEIVIPLWLVGLVGGLIMTRLTWPAFLITGIHAFVGLSMAPFLIFGLMSGLYMNRVKKKRTWLPLIHGMNNLLVVILALTQSWTGYQVYRMFVLGDYS
jgi:hypothetical protein